MIMRKWLKIFYINVGITILGIVGFFLFIFFAFSVEQGLIMACTALVGSQHLVHKLHLIGEAEYKKDKLLGHGSLKGDMIYLAHWFVPYHENEDVIKHQKMIQDAFTKGELYLEDGIIKHQHPFISYIRKNSAKIVSLGKEGDSFKNVNVCDELEQVNEIEKHKNVDANIKLSERADNQEILTIQKSSIVDSLTASEKLPREQPENYTEYIFRSADLQLINGTNSQKLKVGQSLYNITLSDLTLINSPAKIWGYKLLGSFGAKPIYEFLLINNKVFIFDSVAVAKLDGDSIAEPNGVLWNKLSYIPVDSNCFITKFFADTTNQ